MLTKLCINFDIENWVCNNIAKCLLRLVSKNKVCKSFHKVCDQIQKIMEMLTKLSKVCVHQLMAFKSAKRGEISARKVCFFLRIGNFSRTPVPSGSNCVLVEEQYTWIKYTAFQR